MNPHSLVSRVGVLLYGLVCYAVFFVTFCYAIGFVGDLIVPKSIDSPPLQPLGTALLVNAALLAVFAVQHSVMARPFFKRWITRFIPPAAERSTYTLMASLALVLLFWQWRPMGGVVWDVQQPVGRALLYAGFAAGWLLVLAGSFLINHFDLFGLRQAWIHFRARPYNPVRFVMPGPYRFVRHPLYVGFLFAFWCTPHMTLAHLFFAATTAAYILVGIQFEERDLAAVHPEYRAYKQQTPMLVPRIIPAPAALPGEKGTDKPIVRLD